MHVGHPSICALLMPHTRLRPLMFIYVICVSWAAMYLNHHWLVDVLGGYLYATVASLIGLYTSNLIVQKMIGSSGAMTYVELVEVKEDFGKDSNSNSLSNLTDSNVMVQIPLDEVKEDYAIQ